MTPKCELLPRNKFDDEAVEKLALLPEAELRPLLPGLAEWIQDSNWPIAPAVGKLLALHLAALEPLILEVLTGGDDEWKLHLLWLIQPATLPVLSAPLRTSLERLITSPTLGERDWEVPDRARDLLDQYA
jgi:hypothetical protein